MKDPNNPISPPEKSGEPSGSRLRQSPAANTKGSRIGDFFRRWLILRDAPGKLEAALLHASSQLAIEARKNRE